MPTSSPHTLDRFFSGTTSQKIEAMDKLFTRNGQKLKSDKAVLASLALLKEYEAALSEQMTTMNMDSLCCSCAGEAGGGCCSGYMEANSDVLLLLMNRLYGVTVARQHNRAEDCCFLGSRGCTLPVKPMFCLNYNCSHIPDQATAAEMKTLEQLAGQILTEQTRLETLLIHLL
ncbi:MAG TPA: hypothetical protein ENK89_03985 [Desulfobulbaceae bacterium]|nr:hypothetical protein [Desulfobulbaceae bacterium]